MEGCFLAKDGERAGGHAAHQDDESGTGAPSRAPSQGSRLFFSPIEGKNGPTPPEAGDAWLRDHDAIGAWLRGIAPADRPAFLERIAANIASIEAAGHANLEPATPDAILSYAVLIEYAAHLGVSLTEVCWILANNTAEPYDPLLGARVDRMLADAENRRYRPRSPEADRAESRTSLDLSRETAAEAWKTPGRRSVASVRGEGRNRITWTRNDSLALHASAPGRAG